MKEVLESQTGLAVFSERRGFVLEAAALKVCTVVSL